MSRKDRSTRHRTSQKPAAGWTKTPPPHMKAAVHPELTTIGMAILHRPTERVTDFNEARALCENLVALVLEINGAGLAANQIGVAKRVLVVQDRIAGGASSQTRPIVMINPDIIGKSDESVDAWETCFSVPGFAGLVPRAQRIRCRYDTLDGEERVQDFEGFMARVIQHECDHLDGRTYLERLRSQSDFSTEEKLRAEMSQRQRKSLPTSKRIYE